MRVGKHLKIIQLGEKAMGVKLKGDSKKPEPIYFRVVFPFGDVDIVRCKNGSYWVHIRTNRKEDGQDPDRVFGEITNARMDIIGRSVDDCNIGDFDNPDLYHLAVKIGPERRIS